MGPHDAFSDEPGLVVCNCGRRYEGHDARDQHVVHFNIERARAALRGEERDCE